MSLINNLLKDLEKRDKLTKQYANVSLIQPTRLKYDFTLKYKIILIALLILTVLTLGWFITKNDTDNLLLPFELDNVTTKSSETTDILNFSNKPISIIGITLQSKENITEITFLLDKTTLYRLIDNASKDKFSLIFDNAQIQTELPPVKYFNTAITHLQMQKINKDIRFNFTLQPGSEIKYINLNDEQNKPELVIGLSFESKEPAIKTVTPSKIVKKSAMDSLLAEQYQSALTHAEAGEYNIAIMKLSDVLKVDSHYDDARTSLVALLMDQGNQSKAEMLVDEGLKFNPNYSPYVELKARILTSKGKLQEAINLLLTSVPPIADNPEYHSFIAALYERNNNNLLAIKTYRNLLTLNPNNANWWFGLGLALDKINKTNEALNAYNHALNQGHLDLQTITFLQKRLKELQGDKRA